MSTEKSEGVGPRGLPPLEPGDHRHGTLNGYNNRGCRCWACKAASRIYQQNRRKKLRGH